VADLTHLRCVPTGLRTEFDAITALDIEDKPLGGGGFGQNYVCRALNGTTPSLPFVVKVFQNNGMGSALHGSVTIQKLQERLQQEERRREQQGEPPLRDVPALQALPQFCFEAQLRGQSVSGYGALRLDTAGFVPFDAYTEGDADQAADYLALPLETRMQMACDLAEAVVLMDRIGYVHGDINAQNLFINVDTGHLTLIDFDSGAVIEQPGDQPDTWGKPGDWIAPEVLAQLAGCAARIRVDRFSDAWSAGIGMHYLLFLHHPLVYLTDFGTTTLQRYFAANLWPQIDAHDPLSHTGNAPVYQRYRQELHALPMPVQNAFDVLLNSGTFVPDQRPDGIAWLRSFQLAQTPPAIAGFAADRTLVPVGGPITLTWQAENASTVWLSGFGDVTGQNQLRLTVHRNSVFVLTAVSPFGQVSAQSPLIRVVTGPVPPTLRVPAIPAPLRNLAQVPDKACLVPRGRILSQPTLALPALRPDSLLLPSLRTLFARVFTSLSHF